MNESAPLVRLADSELTLADPADDVRGKEVVDRNANKIGEVYGLVIDQDERRVRLLELASGGFLGIGKQKVLVPVDAVSAIDGDSVYIDSDRDQVAKGPVYDPELAPDRATVSDLYSYYGYLPFWHTGYVNPGFPYRVP
ncbi:PRC-barrel domain-containing protein [Saccharothrix sp. AJ9571]|nr:PRC-barrel domain-containing protein [Saccharothrix sp. AJ9571]